LKKNRILRHCGKIHSEIDEEQKKELGVVSAMTKAQVLDDGVHHARLVHRGTWCKAISDLMRTEGIPLPGAERKCF
jgi:hypothetical protein